MSTLNQIYNKLIILRTNIDKKDIKSLSILDDICSNMEAILLNEIENWSTYIFSFDSKEVFKEALKWFSQPKLLTLNKSKRTITIKLDSIKGKICIQTMRSVYKSKVKVIKPNKVVPMRNINNTYEDILYTIERRTKVKDREWKNQFNLVEEMILDSDFTYREYKKHINILVAMSSLPRSTTLVIDKYLKGLKEIN